MKRVLVVGMPRSGSTWVGRVLAAGLGTELLDEPDNHFVSPYAYRVKRRLGQGSYPQLCVDDEAPDYAALWRRAFAIESEGENFGLRARRRVSRSLLQRTEPAHVTGVLAGTVQPRPALRVAERLAVPEQPLAGTRAVVAKSVYAPLAVEWLSALCAPRVVVVLRNPLNVLSSWVQLGWLVDDPLEPLATRLQAELAARYDAPRPTPQWSALERAAWLAGVLTSALADLGDVPGMRVHTTHESLTRSRSEGFRRLVRELDLEWDRRAEQLLVDLDRPGRGFDPTRVSSELEDAWRTRLSPEQVHAARSVLGAFPAGNAWPTDGQR
jgi:Sulfotransferase domain